MGQEQRRFDRVPQTFSAYCRPHGALQDPWRYMITLDLSAGGISLEGETLVEIGDILEVRIQLPGVLEDFILRGRVVRCKTAGAGLLNFALEFLDVTSDEQVQLDELVQFLKRPPPASGPSPTGAG